MPAFVRLLLLLLLPAVAPFGRLRELIARKLEGAPLCTDDDEQCPSFARDGECQRNPGYMSTRCRKSCNVCRTDGGHNTSDLFATCKDDHAQCHAWAKEGECEKNPGCAFRLC